MPRGRAGTAKPIPPGTTYGLWSVVREVERQKYNRRFECKCAGCGTVAIKWLANLTQGKTACLTCTPWSEINRSGREAIIATRRAISQEDDTGRICLTCGKWKPWNLFSDDPRRSRGKTSNCMDCAYSRTIKALYGLTRQEWEWLLHSQNRQCALCGQGSAIRLAVDHDHSCCGPAKACKACIRGMLCRACNRIIGHVDARPGMRWRFADYLDNRPFMTGRVYAGAAANAAP